MRNCAASIIFRTIRKKIWLENWAGTACSGERVKRDLMAEAIRAYMHDPNYLKSLTPRVVATIRAAVNVHPTLSKLIQFNSLVLVALGLEAAGIAGPGIRPVPIAASKA